MLRNMGRALQGRTPIGGCTHPMILSCCNLAIAKGDQYLACDLHIDTFEGCPILGVSR